MTSGCYSFLCYATSKLSILGEFRQGSLAQQSWGPMTEDITEEDMSHAFEDNHTQQQPHMLEAVVSPAEAEANDVFPDTTDR